MAAGSVNGSIRTPAAQCLSAIVSSPKVGTVSSTTVTLKVSVAASPSASVAVQTYSVRSMRLVGAPETACVAASRVTPSGGAGDSV